MSFDLAVFRAARAIDDAGAGALYDLLCTPGGKAERAAREALEETSRLDAFYSALTAIVPELEDDEEQSPFAAAIERRPYAVIMNVSFSRADEVAHTVETLAKAHDLDVFDPQTKRLLRASDPDALRRPAPNAKLTSKDGLERFVAGLAPRLEALGFVPVPRAKNLWGRALPNGVLHQVSLNLATRDVRPDVAVGHAEALAWLSAATGKREALPAMGLGYLYYRGLIPSEPWDDASPGEFGYPICHADCVAGSVVKFAREIERYALPLFDRLGTVEAIVDFFERDTSYSTPRPNWSVKREEHMGAASRFWRADRALLLEVAMGALARPTEARRLIADAERRAETWRSKKAVGWSPDLTGFLARLATAITADPRDAKKKPRTKR